MYDSTLSQKLCTSMQLPNYSAARVLVVGDLMLDRYWHGTTSRISPEAPVPIVQVKTDEERAGGAGNVALNIATLGGKASVIGFVGEDEQAQSLQSLLSEAGVLTLFETLTSHSTITKLRVVSQHQQLMRLDFERGFHGVDNSSLLHRCHAEMMQSKVLVLSDYGKGTLTGSERFIEMAIELNKPVLVDPKGTDFGQYKRATLVTPNLAEFEAVVGPCENQQQLAEKGVNLLRAMDFKALLITQGEQGMTLLTPEQAPLYLPTQAQEVFDVTGAGDTVIALMAASLAANKTLAEATVLANMGAGIVVSKLGATTVSTAELACALQGQRTQQKSINSLTEAKQTLQHAKQRGEKIVLTNGCFDLLHPGHIRYLQQAKALGERLIVLVNSDASVTRLKGPKRPLNNLQHRMEMLAALECVDWVLAFEHDTPEEAIGQLLPDLLVKGGDYTDITAIAGHERVLENGGEIKILPFMQGYSTTSMIKSIRNGQRE